MPNKDLITVVDNPKVPLTELWTADTSQASLQNPFFKPSKGSRSAAESVGSDKPYLKINSVPITEIDLLILDETGQIPKVKAIFTDKTGALSGSNYPKNDPIMSVYIKTQNPKFKAIRCDFLITSIKTNQDPIINAANIDSGATFIMSGELFIPKIYNNVSKGYRNMNSKEALRTIAEDNDLGFACNEFTPNDKMTWLNTNRSSLKFMEHVSKHSYMNDDSFFTAFVDKYYHLTFVNIAEQLNPGHDVVMTYENTADASQFEASQANKEKLDDGRYDVLNLVGLTNRDSHKGKPEYIINYSLMGDTGRILKNKGFKKKVFYYDHKLDNKFTSFYVNPVTIKGYENNVSNRGLSPDNDNLRESTIKKWMNIDYGNAHAEWNASILINDHNNSELNKVKLKVETAGINFQVSRGNGVPILLYNTAQANLSKNSQRTDANLDGGADTALDTDTLVPDGILSGRYYVSGVKYKYDKLNTSFPYITEFQLARVNWLGEKNIVE